MGTKSTKGKQKNPIPQDNAGPTTSSTMDILIDNDDTVNQNISPPTSAPSSAPAAPASASTRSPKKSSTKKQKEDTSLEFIWICTECREAECVTHPDSPLLVCEGSCLRPFHYPCAGLPSLPPNDESWVCHDCTMNKHECCVCHEYGEDNMDVYKCEKKDCGLFYHEACLSMYDVDVVVEAVVDLRTDTFSSNSNDNTKDEMQIDHNMGGDDEELDDAGNKVLVSSGGSGSNSRPKFTCPAHSCWTCSGGPPPDNALEESTEPTATKNSNDNHNTLTKKQGKTKKGAKKRENTFSEKKEKRLFVSRYENMMHYQLFFSFVIHLLTMHSFVVDVV